jgi:sulfite reductase (NADPH) flavoprotein alpha-component
MARTIPVLFGTETGNAEYCADMLVEALTDEGLEAEQIDMSDFSPSDIGSHRVVFIITSTYGNGDPPANAEDLLEHLQSDGLSLPGVHFAVCGLGDSSFTYFAQCGKDFEAALLKCSATQMFERVDCDDDYDVPFERFKESALAYLKEHLDRLMSDAPVAETVSPQSAESVSESKSDQGVTRDQPFSARMLSKRLLSGVGSAKETMHYELDITGSDLVYRVGDCFGVHPTNSKSAVHAVLQGAELDGAEEVLWKGEQTTLRNALVRACLHHVGVDFTKLLAGLPGGSGSPAALALGQGDAALTAFMKDRHVADALQEQPTQGLDPQAFISALRKLQPRLYSIASSPTRDANRVAFTIETLRYDWNNRQVQGVASCWLADQVAEGESVPVYLVKNEAFLFPTDSRPVIMVGPGTGIAPFRAYLEEVEAAGIPNDTWLFFGHQHASKDFLYEEEIGRWKAQGVLTKATYAWSRDQAEKVYVQHRIAEHGAELWSWLQRGAVVYVCGDAVGMAPAVAQAFAELAERHGGESDGKAWHERLVAQERYKADVY